MTEPLQVYEDVVLDLLNLFDTASVDEINDDVAAKAMEWVADRLKALPSSAVESLVQRARIRHETEPRTSSAFVDLREAMGL